VFLAVAALAAAQPAVPVCGYRVVRSFPHDPTSFTEGLLFHNGQLYEGTGMEGRSRVARIDLASGKALAQSAYPPSQFGEGIARWRDQLISVTWQGGIGHRWRLGDLKPLGTFRYAGEGWGMTTLGQHIVRSDGTPSLRFHDPATMRQTGAVQVTLSGRPLSQINELEAIDGEIWANVWMTDQIVRIDPATGAVRSIVDLKGLQAMAGASGLDSVLNGIAWDAKRRRLFVTGKNWPKLFEIKLKACA
jgi:glutamine cyclotransferase